VSLMRGKCADCNRTWPRGALVGYLIDGGYRVLICPDCRPRRDEWRRAEAERWERSLRDSVPVVPT